MAMRYAVDTNVLLRLSHRSHLQHDLISKALRLLVEREVEPCLTPQNVGEFWNVCTRPEERNGLGLSIQDTTYYLAAIEDAMTILPEIPAVYSAWRRLLLSHNICGVQVHDAHLAATLEVNGVGHLLTFNVSDFKRFQNSIAEHPHEVHS